MSNISTWSTTAASNNAASPNGFPENMLPSGVNDSARAVMAAVRAWYEDAEWPNLGHTPVFVSTTSFTIATDVTATYHVGRRLKLTDATTLYGTIATSTYSSPNTTITVTLDSGVLSASLSAVAVGILSKNNLSVPPAVSSQLPSGSIIAWNPGYYSNGSNAGYTYAIGTANTVAAANAYLNPLGFYVCDGAALNDSSSPIFSGAGRYLPNITDSRFLMGSTTVGAIGGNNTMAHTHTHTHTGPSHTHTTGDFTLTINEMPAHTHGFTVDTAGQGASTTRPYTVGTTSPATLSTNSAGSGAAHNHGSTGSSGTGATGSDSTAASNTENRPLYLSCFYIIKVH